MFDETDNEARLHKLAELRQHLSRLPDSAPMKAGMAAIYLDVSTKTLARWRKVENLGPLFVEPVVAPGVNKSTQPYQYRKVDLDNFIASRVRAGGFAFANHLEPWRLNAAGAIEGSALSMSLDELVDSDPLVASLLEAMAEPWATSEAMQPYRDELAGAMQQALAHVDANLQTLQMEERTAAPTGKPRRGGL